MIIDAHHHFWNPARGDYFWMVGEAVAPIAKRIGPKDMAALLTRQGVGKTVLVQAAPTIAETEYMLGLADATDHVAKVVGWIDFENRADLRQLERLAKHPKFSGVRPMIQDLPDKDWMHRKDVQWAYDALIDLDLTFDALGFPIHLENFLRLFQRYPKLRTVIDHCLKPVIREDGFDGWAQGMARIARETPVYCKLSGLATEAAPGWTRATLEPYATHVLASFGPERVMWGSDWPVLNLNGSYDRWLKAAQSYVPKRQQAQVFSKTAKDFYRIR